VQQILAVINFVAFFVDIYSSHETLSMPANERYNSIA
jgi:hypothetical protein